jgi:hypothetical protein
VKSILRRRPTPALVISLIALFVSLSGVSYGVATGFIDSREIKDNEVRSRDLRNNQIRTLDLRNNEVRGIDIRNSTVQGRDVALNTLTGDDINEARMGKVPSAAEADSATSAQNAQNATNATNAASVGGVRLQRISFVAENGAGFSPVLDFGGLQLSAACQAGHILVIGNPAPGLDNSQIVSDTFAANNLDFDTGSNSTVVGVADVTGAGTIAFEGSNGSIVTIQAMALEEPNGVNGTSNDCGFFGIAKAG